MAAKGDDLASRGRAIGDNYELWETVKERSQLERKREKRGRSENCRSTSQAEVDEVGKIEKSGAEYDLFKADDMH